MAAASSSLTPASTGRGDVNHAAGKSAIRLVARLGWDLTNPIQATQDSSSEYGVPFRHLTSHDHFVQDAVLSSDGQFALFGSGTASYASGTSPLASPPTAGV